MTINVKSRRGGLLIWEIVYHSIEGRRKTIIAWGTAYNNNCLKDGKEQQSLLSLLCNMATVILLWCCYGDMIEDHDTWQSSLGPERPYIVIIFDGVHTNTTATCYHISRIFATIFDDDDCDSATVQQCSATVLWLTIAIRRMTHDVDYTPRTHRHTDTHTMTPTAN